MRLREEQRKRLCRLATLISLMLIMSLRFAVSQTPYHLSQLFHRSWTVADGAPALAYDEVQDDEGFLWISTSSGLYKFDGIHFIAFQSPLGEPPVRPQVYFLAKTHSGICGASVLSGVICIDHGHVTSYGTREGLPASPARSLVAGPDGSPWLIAEKRVYHLRDGYWQRDDSTSTGDISAIYFARDGAEWLARDNALFYRRSGQQTFQAADVHWPKGTLLATFADGPKGEFCLTLLNNSKSSDVLRLDAPGDHSPTALRFSFPYEVRDCKFDSSANLWAVGSGVDRISFRPADNADITKGLVGTVEHLGAAAGLSSLETHGATEDNQGNIWIITQRGLDMFRVPSMVRSYPDTAEASTRPVVAAGRNGQVWVGVGKTPIQERLGDQAKTRGSSFDFYYDLVEAEDGTLWFDNGVSLFRMRGNKATPVNLPEGHMALLIRQIVPLPDQSQLVRWEGSLWRLSNGAWMNYSPDPDLHQVPSYLLLDLHKKLWRSYPSGLVTDGEQWFRPAPDQHVESIQLLSETSQGVLAADNLHIYTLREGRLHPLRFANDALITGTSGICEDASGDLWLNGGHGVLHFGRRAFHTAMRAPESNVLEGDLLAEPDLHGPAPTLYNSPTLLRDGSNRLWANTSDAIVFIDPSRALAGVVAPLLSIAPLSADGSLLWGNSPRVPSGTNTVRIPYFGSSLGTPERVHYMYRLEGREDWQDVGSRTEAVYTHLRPGSYSFAVKASSVGGQWTAPVSVSFYVMPRFYQRLWFQLLLALLLLFVAWLVYSAQLRSAATRSRERADERANERIRIAQDLHDTLLQGFQGLMLAFHVAAQEIPPDSRVREQVASSLTRADHVMTEARDRIGKLRSPENGTSLRRAIELLTNEQQGDVAATFRVQVHGVEYDLDPSFQEEMLLIAREAVTNSFRHARAKEVRVELDYGIHTFCMLCCDNGRGITGGRQAGHYGLIGMEERAHRMGATFQCKSSADAGTTIEIRLRKSTVRLHTSLLPQAGAYVRKLLWRILSAIRRTKT